MRKTIIVIASIVILFSCVRNIDDLTFTELNPGFLLPLGTITIGADNLTKMDDSIQVRVGDSKVIEFYYSTEILRTSLFDRFTIGDQSFNDQIPFNSFVFVGGEVNEIKVSAYNSFTLDNSDLPSPAPAMTKIIFKDGFINVNQSKDFDHDMATTISFPTLTKNGVPFSVTLSNNNAQIEQLAGYELDLTGASGMETNTMDYRLSSTIKNTGSSNSGTISFAFQLASMDFSFIQGDFQSYQFDDIEGNFDLGLPETVIPDNIGFTNPKVDLLMENSAGIGMEIDILELSVTQFNGDKLLVTGSFDDEPVPIDGAIVPGERAFSDFSMNKENTDNLPEVISTVPESVFFSGKTTANPNGAPPNGNFITDSSELVVNGEMILPLEGFANNYAIIDTLNDVNLLIDNELISINDVSLRLQVENRLPFDVAMQMYFLDTINQTTIVDSLFSAIEDQKLFFTAEVDNTGLAISPSIGTENIQISNELYEKIKYTKNIKLVFYLLTSGADSQPQKSVRISADDYITIGMGISVNALVDLNKATSN